MYKATSKEFWKWQKKMNCVQKSLNKITSYFLIKYMEIKMQWDDWKCLKTNSKF